MADDKPKRGRPSRWDDPKQAADTLRAARKACVMGATDEDLAELFGVNRSTITAWKIDYPDFSATLKEARDERDAQVERRLYERAMGYSHQAVKIFCGKDGQVTEVPYTEHYPPDTTAMIFWLKNRQPAAWRDVRDINVNRDKPIEKLSTDELFAIAGGARDPAPAEGTAKPDRVH